MNREARSIQATLAYYGALRWPLSVVELSRRLIPARRFEDISISSTMDTLLAELERLETEGHIRAQSGLYVMGDAPPELVDYRVERHMESAQKWRSMLRWAWWLQAVPFLRMLSASGSLALGSSSHKSDWDMFAIVQAGRLYTARFGLLVVCWLMGRLRTKNMRTAPDRFCFNHIITTDGLSIRHRSLFTAHALAWLVAFYDPWNYASKLRTANEWVLHFSTTSLDEQFVRRTIPHSRILGMLRWSCEKILLTPFGALVEYCLRRWMQSRIAANPETEQPGGRIVADNRELEFHPHSFEAVALARYNAALVRLGLGQFAEHDSGLVH